MKDRYWFILLIIMFIIFVIELSLMGCGTYLPRPTGEYRPNGPSLAQMEFEKEHFHTLEKTCTRLGEPIKDKLEREHWIEECVK